jgi:23S rRNA (uracil1939-C5)-methyltransferase
MKRAMLTIERLGRRGEGVARGEAGPVFVPFALPGETVAAMVDGERGSLLDVEKPSPDRVVPFCPWFTQCGGCAVQNLALDAQWRWKRDLVVFALSQAGLDAPVEPCRDAHGFGRRRATFHARRGADGRMQVGFMAARSHDLVAIDACPLFAPALDGALVAARSAADALGDLDKPLDLLVTATDNGLDMDIRGAGPIAERHRAALIGVAQENDLARLTHHGAIVIARKPPVVTVAGIPVALPAGAFLQATQAGEDMLASLVVEAARDAKRIADLYCGIGTFALRLARRAQVFAVESHADAVAALHAAAGASPELRALRAEIRDLARRPLTPEELKAFDCVVFDPPRAGAAEQVAALAKSEVPLVVAVSCNPQTFARDAKTLVDGGYTLERVTPVDQFRHSPHVELVGVFRRAGARKKRRLLG